MWMADRLDAGTPSRDTLLSFGRAMAKVSRDMRRAGDRPSQGPDAPALSSPIRESMEELRSTVSWLQSQAQTAPDREVAEAVRTANRLALQTLALMSETEATDGRSAIPGPVTREVAVAAARA
jgi:hypothetical protein